MKKKLLLSILTCVITLNIFSQENDIEEISKDACNCISEIPTNFTEKEKGLEIEDCIKSANTTYQLTSSFNKILNQKKDTINKVDTLVIGKKDINIVINDEENYKQIEGYLYENCKSLKDISLLSIVLKIL